MYIYHEYMSNIIPDALKAMDIIFIITNHRSIVTSSSYSYILDYGELTPPDPKSCV
jgi:hypothetical protein